MNAMCTFSRTHGKTDETFFSLKNVKAASVQASAALAKWDICLLSLLQRENAAQRLIVVSCRYAVLLTESVLK